MRYRKSTLLIGVMMIAVLLVGIGCDEGKNMIGDVVGPPDEPDDKPTDLTMNGEVKQPDPGDTDEPVEPEPDTEPTDPPTDPEPETEPEPEPVPLIPELEYGVTHNYVGEVPQSDIFPSSAWVVANFPGPHVWHPRPTGSPNDFIGRVLMPIGGKDTEWAADSHIAPVSKAIVTITDGPRAGEQVLTDEGGHYHFKGVEGDQLHLRVERQWLEPREVIVHRCCETIPQHFRANHIFFLRDVGPGATHGTVMMGLRWPDVVRPILENELLPHDLLISAFDADEEDREWMMDLYGGGVITNHSFFPFTVDSVELSYGTIAHEIARARQSVDTLLRGVDESRWGETPQGREYGAAWRKDLSRAPQSGMEIDNRYEDDILENAAGFCSLYWLGNGDVQTIAPNRYKWAQTYLDAHPQTD